MNEREGYKPERDEVRSEVGKATPLPPKGGSGVSSIVSTSASELKEIKDMFVSIRDSMVYMTKLLEAMVNNLSLANKSKKNASEVMQMNSQLLKGLFANKEFEGKDQFLALIDKIQKMGSE